MVEREADDGVELSQRRLVLRCGRGVLRLPRETRRTVAVTGIEYDEYRPAVGRGGALGRGQRPVEGGEIRLQPKRRIRRTGEQITRHVAETNETLLVHRRQGRRALGLVAADGVARVRVADRNGHAACVFDALAQRADDDIVGGLGGLAHRWRQPRVRDRVAADAAAGSTLVGDGPGTPFDRLVHAEGTQREELRHSPVPRRDVQRAFLGRLGFTTLAGAKCGVQVSYGAVRSDSPQRRRAGRGHVAPRQARRQDEECAALRGYGRSGSRRRRETHRQTGEQHRDYRPHTSHPGSGDSLGRQ